jgi:hypothetical protein
MAEDSAAGSAEYLERVAAFALREQQPDMDASAYKVVRLAVHDVIYTCIHAGRNHHLAPSQAFTATLARTAIGTGLEPKVLPLFWGLLDGPARSPHKGLFSMAAAMAVLAGRRLPEELARPGVLQAVADGVLTGMLGIEQRSFREAIEALVLPLGRQPELLPQYIAMLAH